MEHKEKVISIKDIMTKKVISVSPNTLVLDAAKIISDHNFDGIPVADENGYLVGIITEYDLITKTSSINASFLQRILYDIHNKETKNEEMKAENGLAHMKVKDIMNREPLYLMESATFNEVINSFITHHRVNPIPIVDKDKKLVGIVSRFDILRPLNLIGYGLKK